MEKEFVPYEQALSLKELGFDEPCFAWFVSEEYGLEFGKVIKSDLIKDGVVASTYSGSFRWFREKYNLLGNVYSNASGWLWEIHDNIGGTHRFGSEWSGDCEESGMFTSFEKAELECLKKLIEIVKNK